MFYVSEKRSFVRYNGTLSFCFAVKSFFNAKYARDTQGTQRGFCIIRGYLIEISHYFLTNAALCLDMLGFLPFWQRYNRQNCRKNKKN